MVWHPYTGAMTVESNNIVRFFLWTRRGLKPNDLKVISGESIKILVQVNWQVKRRLLFEAITLKA